MEGRFGIDVSDYQGTVNWEKAKAAGVRYAILKCGYGMDRADQDDACFRRNAAECARLGIPFGVYLYSYADTAEKVDLEAAHVLRLREGLHPALPVFWDLEEERVAALGPARILEGAKRFAVKVEAAGYSVGFYANLHWWETLLTDVWYDAKPRWVAQYHTECEYEKRYDLWQYTGRGRVDGIDGDVDGNRCYRDDWGVAKPAPTQREGETVMVETIMIRLYTSGNAVRTLQAALKDRGYDIGWYGTDGICGDATVRAIRKFQQDNGLDIDGICGPKTWAKLLN